MASRKDVFRSVVAGLTAGSDVTARLAAHTGRTGKPLSPVTVRRWVKAKLLRKVPRVVDDRYLLTALGAKHAGAPVPA